MAIQVGTETCWACGAEVARGVEGTACPNCGPLMVTHGFEVRWTPFTGKAVFERIDYCPRCGLDTCLGCEGA